MNEEKKNPDSAATLNGAKPRTQIDYNIVRKRLQLDARWGTGAFGKIPEYTEWQRTKMMRRAKEQAKEFEDMKQMREKMEKTKKGKE